MADVSGLINRDLSLFGAEIKAAYEEQANTNAFTDGEKTKVAASITQIGDDQTPQLAGPLDADGNTIANFLNIVDDLTGTTYTAALADTGRVKTLTNAAAIALSLPNNLPKGWSCCFVAGGDGAITVGALTGATLRNRSSHTKTAGKYAVISLFVISNVDNVSAVYVLAGDTAL